VPRQLEFEPNFAREDFAREVVQVPVATEMSESFLAYSLSVITSRAIPDVRDGLKPVQRRILWSMLQMGVRPTTPFRKSARIVGDTMGRYHPHGDSAIYDALTRMGQDFSRMVPFIDPQGNFGSLDDPPAASRYTECRLSPAAMRMVSELDEDTVDFRSTYDGEGEEPIVMPAALPNIIVNGTSGIAVGMATNMAPHNLAEVEAAVALVMTKRRPKPTIDELMEVLPGPDFPSGGIIIDDGLREAYETGRGSFRIRARAHVEQISSGRQAIVVTELPYLVGAERVIAKIKDLVAGAKINGITGFADLSDHTTDSNAVHIQIDVKAGANPQAVLHDLYRQTPLEETFGINNVVLVDGVPTTLGLYDLCRHYIDHRLDVIVRRTRHRLAKRLDRLHIAEGLLVALDAIDEVVAIIRSSQDAAEARTRLIERFDLSQIQAAHILEMPLRRLTALAKLELEEEMAALRADAIEFEKILGSEQRRRTTVLKELHELTADLAVPRRAEIVKPDEIPTFEGPLFVENEPADAVDEPCLITVSTSGNIACAVAGGGKRATAGRHDLIACRAITTTSAQVVAITSEGRVFPLRGADLPDVSGRTRGSDVAQLLGLNRGESVLALIPPAVGDPDRADKVVVVTTTGVAKRLTIDEVLATKAGRTIIGLKDSARVVAAFPAPDNVDLLMVASDGQALRTAGEAVSVQGRGAGGVAGMKLRKSSVVAAAPVPRGMAASDHSVIAVTSASGLKATPVSEIPSKGRGTQGVRLVKLASGQVVTLAVIGPGVGLLAQMSADDDPRKLDPHPVPLWVEPTRRDLIAVTSERQIRVISPGRW